MAAAASSSTTTVPGSGASAKIARDSPRGKALARMKELQASVQTRYKEGHGKTHFAKELRDAAIAFIDGLEANVPASKHAELLESAFALRSLLRGDKKRPFPFASIVARELASDFRKDFKDLLKFDPSMFRSRTSERVKDLNLIEMYSNVKEGKRMQLFVDVWHMFWVSHVIVMIESAKKTT